MPPLPSKDPIEIVDPKSGGVHCGDSSDKARCTSKVTYENGEPCELSPVEVMALINRWDGVT